MLVAMLLMLLAGGIVTATIQLAARQYRARTQEADAQLLCSALSLFVQNELTYAGDLVSGTENQLAGFTDHVQGFGKNCAFVITDEGHLAVEYGGNRFEAVGKGAYGGRDTLRVERSIICDDPDDIRQVSVTIQVFDEDGAKPLAENVFSVRPLAP